MLNTLPQKENMIRAGNPARVVVLVPAKMAVRLNALATRRGLSRSAFVRSLLCEAVQREEQPAKREASK